MARYDYTLLDVFTDRAFGGNQLAVFLNPEGLSTAQMQSLARELNLAETTFVFPPRETGSDFRVRIFTAVLEMPMAGHPTVGTAFELARQGLIGKGEAETVTRFEEGVGIIPVKVRFENNLPVFCQMQQPLPVFGPVFNDTALVAKMLGLEQDNLENNLPAEVVSCGVPYLIVPVKDLSSMERIRFQPAYLEEVRQTTGFTNVYAFTTQGVTGAGRFHSRMFWYEEGVMGEDAATGSASGPLGCYLAKHGLLGADRVSGFVNEQGFEMERPSFIHVEIERDGENQIKAVRVGGQSYFMGGGYFEVN